MPSRAKMWFHFVGIRSENALACSRWSTEKRRMTRSIHDDRETSMLSVRAKSLKGAAPVISTLVLWAR